MKTKLKMNIATVLTALLVIKVGPAIAQYCIDGHYTVPATIQSPDCGPFTGNGCVGITESPTYEHPAAYNYCTGYNFTGEGTNVLNVIWTTSTYTCSLEDLSGSWVNVCEEPHTSTYSTNTVNYPLIFNSCQCGG